MRIKLVRMLRLSLLGMATVWILSVGVMISQPGVEIKHESVRLKVVGPNIRHYGSAPSGVLYTRADKAPKTAVIIMHPESDNRNDWRCIPLAKAGFAVFGMAPRYMKENQHLIMEETVLDVAEAIRFLKEERGMTHVVLHGHSGGGSMVGFYQAQASKNPPNRLKSTPAGDPPDLNQFDLPKADGLIISASHRGRGWAVLRKLDPSVVDEDDPLSWDPSLDMYNPENGFRPPPEPTKYSEEFMTRFKAGQRARMQRLVEKALRMVEEKRLYQKLTEAPDFKKRPLQERLRIQRGAVLEPYMLIYRNVSVPQYVDLRIDPSDRAYGSFMGERVDLGNYSWYFHPRGITAEAFLSSESTASNVDLLKDLPGVTSPLLVMIGTADKGAYISGQKAWYQAAASKDKELVLIEGANHRYLPEGPKVGEGNQREEATQVLVDWLSKRFPF